MYSVVRQHFFFSRSSDCITSAGMDFILMNKVPGLGLISFLRSSPLVNCRTMSDLLSWGIFSFGLLLASFCSDLDLPFVDWRSSIASTSVLNNKLLLFKIVFVSLPLEPHNMMGFALLRLFNQFGHVLDYRILIYEY